MNDVWCVCVLKILDELGFRMLYIKMWLILFKSPHTKTCRQRRYRRSRIWARVAGRGICLTRLRMVKWANNPNPSNRPRIIVDRLHGLWVPYYLLVPVHVYFWLVAINVTEGNGIRTMGRTMGVIGITITRNSGEATLVFLSNQAWWINIGACTKLYWYRWFKTLMEKKTLTWTVAG